MPDKYTDHDLKHDEDSLHFHVDGIVPEKYVATLISVHAFVLAYFLTVLVVFSF